MGLWNEHVKMFRNGKMLGCQQRSPEVTMLNSLAEVSFVTIRNQGRAMMIAANIPYDMRIYHEKKIEPEVPIGITIEDRESDIEVSSGYSNVIEGDTFAEEEENDEMPEHMKRTLDVNSSDEEEDYDKDEEPYAIDETKEANEDGGSKNSP
eukprot:15339685-Ditylum_brightwellii.AAC.2